MATRPIPGNRNHPILPFKAMKSTSLISLLALALLCWASPGLAQTTTVTPSTTTLLPQGGDITFSVNTAFTGSATFGFTIKVPATWTYVSGTNEPSLKPEVGETDGGEGLGWTATSLQTGPVNFTFTLRYPAGVTSATTSYQTTLRPTSSFTQPTTPATSFTAAAPQARR